MDSNLMNQAVRNALNTAIFFAARQHHMKVLPEHVLFGLLHEPTPETIKALGGEGHAQRVFQEVMRFLENQPQKKSGLLSAELETGKYVLPFHERMGQMMSACREKVKDDPSIQIDEALLLHFLGEVQTHGLQDTPAREEGSDDGSILAMLGRDLTQEARQGKIDRVVGRDQEIERTFEILSRRQKNNPVLIGEPGVGKTAIAEGLAYRLIDPNIPEHLRGVRLIQIDVPSIMAGAGYRGAVEQRLKVLLAEVEAAKGKIVLFVDEVHTLVVNARTDPSADIAQIFKPALARGTLRLLGATTPDDWKRHIERDRALVRRLQRVLVEEPTAEATRQILLGIRAQYEAHHHVTIPDETIDEAIRISGRFINDRAFPDKAIDLMDEAAARVRLRSTEALPPVLPMTVADIASSWCGVPVGAMVNASRDMLQTLGAQLRTRVVAQETAIDTLVRAVRRHRAGVGDPNRPAGVYLLAGPTGVGKTELAKALAEALFGSQKALTRFDMSEYQERHATARLIGSPPGYVGHDEGGSLVEAVKRRPHQVLLFDEVEKAHPALWDTFLQVFDDGRLTDGQGRTASFRDTVILMTTNMGMEARPDPIGFARQAEGPQERVLEAVKQQLRPELRNRFDDILIFHPLQPSAMLEIVEAAIKRLKATLYQGRCLELDVSQDVKAWLAEHGFDAEFGARPLGRLIARTIQDPIADLLLDGTLIDGMTASVTLGSDGPLVGRAKTTAPMEMSVVYPNLVPPVVHS